MNNNQNVKFFIGDIPIYNPVMLAPMDGFTDLPFRTIAKSFGAGIVFSEFINGLDVLNNHPHLHQLTKFSESERVFAYQIFDDSPQRILDTALILQDKKPDFIDINMGCSAKNVSSRGAGAGLLKTPEKIKTIFQLLTSSLQIPITGKIRLGWDNDHLNYLEVAKILEDNGAAMITVHGRTKQQGYSGFADWKKITEVKRAVKIPVIANGDVLKVADIERIISETGCDGVMIGRAALKNPWIFSYKDKNQISKEEIWRVFNLHLHSMIEFYGVKTGLLLFRKHIRSYIDVTNLTREERTHLFNQKKPDRLISKAAAYLFE
ncbi:MAG: tRNA dihydrouridine synthase DusB [Anaerolineaceae bacterium]|nr:tRNA dihydrouridine synthase DusB [Anaerolineaceae bacterium]